MSEPASSFVVTVSCAKHREVLVDGLWRFFQLNHCVDFEIGWGGRTIRAHQLVLDVFLTPEKLFPNGAVKKARANRQSRDDCMDHLMEFLYTGKVEVRRDQLDRLLEVAKQLDFQMLADAIELTVLNDKAQRGLSRVWMYSEKKRDPAQKTPGQNSSGQTADKELTNDNVELSAPAASYIPLSVVSGDDLFHPRNGCVANSDSPAIHTSEPPANLARTADPTPTVATNRGISNESTPAHVTTAEPRNSVVGVQAVNRRSSVPRNERTGRATVAQFQPDGGGEEATPPQPRPARRKAPFICDVCGKVFKRSQVLDEHAATHTGAKPYKCAECGKAYSQRGALLVHGRVHTGVRPFRCEQCGKSFTQSCSLSTHKLTHTKERPYRCDLCDLSYRRREGLIAHRFTHTDEKKVKCQFCDQVFADRRERSLHMLSHSGQSARVCQHCGMLFGHRKNLNAHLRKHRDVEKPVFQCEICGKSLTSRLGLKLHARIHTGEKPHKCDICGKCFRRDNALAAHVMIHKK